MSEDSATISQIQSRYPVIPLKYGVERKVDKDDSLSDSTNRVSLDMVEPWQGCLKDEEKEANASTGLVKFEPGDVLFSKLRPYLAKAFIAERTGAGSPEFLVLRPKKFEDAYLLYLLLSTEFIDRVNASTTGASLPRASWNFIGDLKVPCPNLETQKKISSYLDSQLRTIDQARDHLDDLTELLEERRDASVLSEILADNHPDINNQDDWVAALPDRYSVIKLKWVSEIVDTKHRTAEYVEDGIPIISPSEVSATGLDLDGANRTTEQEYVDLIEDGREPQVSDIIYSRNASVGAAALVQKDTRMCMGQDICLIRSASSEFLYFVLNSPIITQQVEAMTVGATFDRINISDLEELLIPWPPETERKQITKNIESQAREIKQLERLAKEADRILEEKRQALITKAVTGQIDLSDWQPPDKQEVPQ